MQGDFWNIHYVCAFSILDKLIVGLLYRDTAFAVVLVQYLECFLQCTCGAYVP